MAHKNRFGTAVKDLREMIGLSQHKAAKKAGIDRVTWLRVEKGHEAPRMDTVEAMAKALGTTPSKLLAA
jgi:transcriptional regulator with XRE-family HTH domain